MLHGGPARSGKEGKSSTLFVQDGNQFFYLVIRLVIRLVMTYYVRVLLFVAFFTSLT